MILAHTTESIIQLRLPASIDQISSFHPIVNIRDTFDFITELNLLSVTVLPDFSAISNFSNILQKSNSNPNSDPILQLLTSGDQNTVGQLVISISQVFNELNSQNMKIAVMSKYFFVEFD